MHAGDVNIPERVVALFPPPPIGTQKKERHRAVTLGAQEQCEAAVLREKDAYSTASLALDASA